MNYPEYVTSTGSNLVDLNGYEGKVDLEDGTTLMLLAIAASKEEAFYYVKDGEHLAQQVIIPAHMIPEFFHTLEM